MCTHNLIQTEQVVLIDFIINIQYIIDEKGAVNLKERKGVYLNSLEEERERGK